ncbi:MAG TPA: hypothetical protein VF787_26375 [Thermoanaerobaculia bacterium]
MTAQEWFWVTTAIAQLVSTCAIFAAAFKYYRRRDHPSGETLRLLEDRFKDFHQTWEFDVSGHRKVMPPITRAIEHDGDEFTRCKLESSIRKGASGEPASRDDCERAWIPRLDALLRFLMIVSAMEKNRLLKKEALWDAYHYWFRTVNNNVLVRIYIGLHFPVLDRFLRENAEELQFYEDLHAASIAAAKARYALVNSPPAASTPDTAASAGTQSGLHAPMA